MAVKSTFDFDQMLSSAREAYAEELLRMADSCDWIMENPARNLWEGLQVKHSATERGRKFCLPVPCMRIHRYWCLMKLQVHWMKAPGN